MTDVVAEQDLRVRSIVLRCTGSESGRRDAEVANELQLSTSLLLILERDLLGPADPRLRFCLRREKHALQ